MPTIEELKALQALPLERKIMITQTRIFEWYSKFKGNVSLSFSGGKDSTVLSHIIDGMGLPIEKVYSDTGLEYPEVRKFVKERGDVLMLRPKMRFDEVIKRYGYPLIGKEVSMTIYYARKGSAWANNYLDGLNSKGKAHKFKESLYAKWKPLVDVDFMISDKCCHEMKEKTLDDYFNNSGKKTITAIMASESQKRQTAWLMTGCNAFKSKKPMSKPMSFWTEQDVLAYIKKYDVPIASVYGDIVYENNGAQYAETLCDCGCKLKTTGCDRTGCIFCGFGAHLEKGESRFQRLKRTHPRQYEYCLEGGAYDTDGLWKPTKEGLGMRHVFDEVNKIYGKDFIRY